MYTQNVTTDKEREMRKKISKNKIVTFLKSTPKSKRIKTLLKYTL